MIERTALEQALFRYGAVLSYWVQVTDDFNNNREPNRARLKEYLLLLDIPFSTGIAGDLEHFKAAIGEAFVRSIGLPTEARL